MYCHNTHILFWALIALLFIIIENGVYVNTQQPQCMVAASVVCPGNCWQYSTCWQVEMLLNPTGTASLVNMELTLLTTWRAYPHQTESHSSLFETAVYTLTIRVPVYYTHNMQPVSLKQSKIERNQIWRVNGCNTTRLNYYPRLWSACHGFFKNCPSCNSPARLSLLALAVGETTCEGDNTWSWPFRVVSYHYTHLFSTLLVFHQVQAHQQRLLSDSKKCFTNKK